MPCRDCCIAANSRPAPPDRHPCVPATFRLSHSPPPAGLLRSGGRRDRDPPRHMGFEFGGEASPPPFQERSRGALLGLAVGDALGTTLAFREPKSPPFPQLATGPHRDMVGGGPFKLVAGQVTDVTQMACCLAASLRARGRFDAAGVAARYVGWQEHAFEIDGQIAAALNAIREGAAPLEAGEVVWARSPKPPAGNASLARTAPIGVLVPGPEARRAAALADCAITHHDPRCRLACAAFDAALAVAIRGAAAPTVLRDAAARELWDAA